MYIYIYIGWFNVALLAVMTAPYWLRFLNNHTLRLKGGAYAKTIKFLRKIHKPLGLFILLLALYHGYLALGALRPHTGVLVWLAVFLTASLGLSFYLTKKKTFFKWHKRMVLAVLALLLLHLLFPSALYYILY
jgi:hypothetical protein